MGDPVVNELATRAQGSFSHTKQVAMPLTPSQELICNEPLNVPKLNFGAAIAPKLPSMSVVWIWGRAKPQHMTAKNINQSVPPWEHLRTPGR